MKLEFTYTADDYLALIEMRARPRWIARQRPREVLFIRVVNFLTPLAAIGTLAVYVHDHPPLTARVVATMVVTGVFVGTFVLAIVVTEGRRHKLRKIEKWFLPMSATLDDQGVHHGRDGRESQFERWDSLDRIVEEGDRFFLHRSGTPRDWLILPGRGLSEAKDIDDLRDLLRLQVQPPTGGFPMVPA